MTIRPDVSDRRFVSRETSLASRAWRAVTAAVSRIRAALRERAECAQLLSLDDRTLRDIGMSRFDLYVASESKDLAPQPANENRPARVA